jgi:mannobiose 2-epimerase
VSPELGADEAVALADAFESSWRTSIISFWYPRAIDPEGGYRVGWDARGRPGPDERGTVSQARLVYVFSRAARAGHRSDAMLGAARHGLAYLRDVLWDAEHGGFVWSLDRPQKTTYAQAFALFALAELVRAGGDDDARELAVRTFDLLETNAHDDTHGGYFELFAEDWSPAPARDRSPIDRRPPKLKLVNTHMHLMEAMVAAHRVALDPRATTRAAELVGVFTDRAVRRGHGAALTDAWRREWRPAARDKWVRYGHLPEVAWLLVDSAAAIGAPMDAPVQVAERMLDYVARYGTDSEGGIWRQGPLGKPVTDRHYEWWAQAEALMAYAVMLGQTEGDRREVYADRLRAVWAFIRRYCIDAVVGEWHDLLGPDRRGQGPKGSGWKAGYHSTRALLDAAALLRAGYHPGP